MNLIDCLIPVYNINQITKRFATVIFELTSASNLPATLLFLESSEENEDSEDKEKKDISTVEQETISQLNRAGVGEEQIRTSSLKVASISEAIKNRSKSGDLVILVEANASERKSYVHKIWNEMSDVTSCPLLVVFAKREEKEK